MSAFSTMGDRLVGASPRPRRVDADLARAPSGDVSFVVELAADRHLAPGGFMWGMVNHACAPNCALDLGRRVLRSIRTIAPGEELTFNYLTTEWRLAAPFVCDCAGSTATGRNREVPRPEGARADAHALAGVAMVLAATALWASIGAVACSVRADFWTILLWRSAVGGLVLLALTVARSPRRALAEFRALGRPGLGYALALAAGTLLYVPSIHLSSVAEVAVIYATMPLITAALAWRWLGQSSDRVTLAASLAALAGVAVTVGVGVGEAHLLGQALGLAMTLAYAAQVVIMRRHDRIAVAPAVCLAALLVVLATLPFATPLATPPAEVGLLALSGILSGGLADALFARGSQRMPPARTALLTMLEGPLATGFAWLVASQTPSRAAVAGGAIVLASVALSLCRRERAGTTVTVQG